MGIQERRIREKERRREDILSVTRSLIVKKGVRELSLQDVANALEISKATLYLSFQNKDDLLKEILNEAGGAFLAFLEERVNEADSGLGSLIAMAQGYFEFYTNQEESFVLFGIKDYFAPAFPFVGKDVDVDLPDVFVELVRTCLKRGVADGSLDPSINPEAMIKPIVFLATSLVDKVAKIPSEERSSFDILPQMKNAFSLLLRAVAHPAIPRDKLDKSLATGSSKHLSVYWKE